MADEDQTIEAMLGIMDEGAEETSPASAASSSAAPAVQEGAKPADETVSARQYHELQEAATRSQQTLAEIKGQLKAWGVTVDESGRIALDPAYQQAVTQQPRGLQEEASPPPPPAAQDDAEEYFVLKSDLDRAVANAVERALSQNIARTEQRIVGTQMSVARQSLSAHKESLRRTNPYFGRYETEVDAWFEQELAQSAQAQERFRQDPVGTYEIYRHLVLGRKVDEGAARRQPPQAGVPFTETGGTQGMPRQGENEPPLDITRDEQALLGSIIRRAAGEDNDYRAKLAKAARMR